MRYRIQAELWLHEGDTSWRFVTLPTDVADEIEETSAPTGRGFGSVRVAVTVGATTWETSLFPDTKAGSYVLPVKKPVRTKEGLEAGDLVDLTIEVAG
jgi:hypothetical protein